ncbi:MAG: sulfatase [Planctomycetes bacterium]|nr:sulfatase [Planctomycetota bacterium]
MKVILNLLLALIALASWSASAQDKLNVVFFLVDDLGWMDLGCQGSKYYHTPNIDRLAEEGMRFTDAYAACNVCSPTRAAIMTGKYPARLMLTQWLPAGRWQLRGHRLREARFLRSLPLEEITLAEALREAGYATLHVGKWHLGGPPFSLPKQHGFDTNVAGSEHGAPGGYWFPYTGKWTIPTTGSKVVKRTLPDGKEGEYLTDRLTEEAIKLIRANRDRPFFLYFPYYAVHAPLQGKRELAARYERVPEAKRQGKPRYAAMVESVDESVGRIMGTLQQLGLSERTLVVFTSDNGGFASATNNAPLRANKGSNYEGGLRVPLIIKWPGKILTGSVTDVPVISTDFYPTLLEALGLPARPHQHLDGISLVPLLTGRGLVNRRALYWHYPHYNRHPHSAPSGVIRKGKWKLIEHFETGKRELFDLEDDLGEANDLAEAYPEITRKLQADLVTWRTEVGADMPRHNPEYLNDKK